MRSLFPENFPPSEDVFSALWRDAIIVFDTNVLMDFHAWPRERAEWFIAQCREQMSGRLWIPNQVGREFTRNRTVRLKARRKSIEEELKGISGFISGIESTILGKLSNVRINPDKSTFPDVATPIREWLVPIEENLREEDQDLNERLNLDKDYIFSEIETAFSGKIGEPFPLDVEMKLYAEGEARYAGSIPPGFGDIKNKPENYRLYGDFFIWKQILNYASTTRVPGIILVTNDSRKGDWFNGDKPHPELLREFAHTTGGKPFWVYTFANFLYQAEQHGLIVGEQNYQAALNQAEQDAKERERRLQYAEQLERIIQGITQENIADDYQLIRHLRNNYVHPTPLDRVVAQAAETLSRLQLDYGRIFDEAFLKQQATLRDDFRPLYNSIRRDLLLGTECSQAGGNEIQSHDAQDPEDDSDAPIVGAPTPD